MLYTTLRPRITDCIKMSALVVHLRREGVDDTQMARRMTEIGVIDLDMLKEVMRLI